MSNRANHVKASEQFRERLISRYISATTDLAQPAPGVDVTDSSVARLDGSVPRSSTDTALTAFAQLGALRLNASHALISLIDTTHQYVLAEATKSLSTQSDARHNKDDGLWIGSVVLPRAQGICDVVLSNSPDSATDHTQDGDGNGDVVVINDLREDPRFCLRKFVASSPGMRFYAGAPILSPDGTKIGAYCVLDVNPRQGLSTEEKIFLRDTAKTVMSHLEAVRIQAEYQRRDRLVAGLESFVGGLSEISTEHKDAIASPKLAKQAPHEPFQLKHPRQDPAAPKMEPENDMSSTKSLSMWELALPFGCKSMFSRAANIVRASGDYDGVTFFYVSSGDDRGRALSRPGQVPGLHHQSVRPSSSSPSSSSSTSPTRSPFNATEDFATQSPMEELSSGDETGYDHACPLLGCSLSPADEQSRLGNRIRFPRFRVRDLQKLIGSRPRGRVYLLDRFGHTLPGDTSGSGSGADYPSPVPQSITTSASSNIRKKSRAAQVKALLKLNPQARAFVCLPLWDYNRQRWFAFAICWITTPTRDPGIDGDLDFLRIFGNSITNALAHLDSLEADRARTSFVASMSHELRSPLHGILGATNFLYDSNLNRFQQEMVDTITSCGHTLLDTLEHVLDFTKINNFTERNPGMTSKAGVQDMAGLKLPKTRPLASPTLTSSVDMSLVVEEVVEAVAIGFTVQHEFVHSDLALEGAGGDGPTLIKNQQAPANGLRKKDVRGRVRLCLDLPAGDCTFETEAGGWRRIIMNLVANALKYTEQGVITVSLRMQDVAPDPDGHLFGRPGQEDNRASVTLAIQDTGLGISNEFLQDHIFKPFSQEDSFAPGTGLGLSIVDQIVRSMGGSVEISSAKGMGSTFTVQVVLDKGLRKTREILSTDSLMASVAKRLQGLRVCILEDSNSKGSKDNSEGEVRAEAQFSRILVTTLKAWFSVDAVVESCWTPGSADLVLCLEPSFRHLESVRSSNAGQPPPPVLLIAHDVLEMAVLRADSRVLGEEFLVEITHQPLGPRKLAKAFLHCLDRAQLSKPRAFPDSLIPPEIYGLPLQSRQMTASAVRNVQADGLHAGVSEADHSRPLSGLISPSSPVSVLCVDDNPLNLRLLTALLKSKKLPYMQASNGQEAVDAYKSAPGSFCCVLMDISMPVMDGMTATRVIREFEGQNSLSRVPIIALTGLASAAARNEAIEAGMDRFMTKPVSFAELAEIIARATLSSLSPGKLTNGTTKSI